VTSSTVVRWESRIEKVRERRLFVLCEKDDLPDDWFGCGCLGASIEDDLRYLKDLERFARSALSKSVTDEATRLLLEKLEEPTDRLSRLESWIEAKERRGERDGPPPDCLPLRQLVTTSSQGANAPPVKVSSNTESVALVSDLPRRSVDLVT